MNKKGNLDNIFILMSLFVLGIFLFAGYMVLSSAQPAFANTDTANNLVLNAMKMLSRLGNIGFICVTLALLLTNIIGAYFLLTHPVFVIVDLILMPISIWFASILSNAYSSSIGGEAIMTGVMVGVDFILKNLPWIIVGMDVIVAIFAYALVKNR